MVLNNLFDDMISKMKYIDEFAMYLANTVNFTDTIKLMERYPDFNESIHADLSNTPIEDVKAIGMDYTNMQIKYIKANDHCLRDSFTSGEAISPKQFKEVSVNIGTKPDGQGGIFPYIIKNTPTSVTLPDSYQWKESDVMAPMIAQYNPTNLTFKHLAGIIKISLKNVPATATKFVFKANKDITGDFAIKDKIRIALIIQSIALIVICIALKKKDETEQKGV